jgi:hypothetical protein
MNATIATSLALSIELGEWLTLEAKARDTSASALMRTLLRNARQEVWNGPGPPGWPPYAALARDEEHHVHSHDRALAKSERGPRREGA